MLVGAIAHGRCLAQSRPGQRLPGAWAQPWSRVLERWGQGPPRKRVGCEARARCVEVIIKKPTPGLAKRRFARGHRGGWLQSCPVEASPFTTVLTWDDYASRITSSLGTRHADENGQ